MSPRDWDAATYDRVAAPQFEWGRRVLERLPLAGDETVMDAGCGSGRVTRMLLERLPGGHVVAVDAAPSMVELARVTLAAEQATVIEADLVELSLDQPVDAVFSSAVFHWVLDHDALFAALFAALRPGGRLIAQCGGEGNVERLHERARDVAEREPYREYLGGWLGPWNFAAPEETAVRLEQAGFIDVETGLEPAPAFPEQPVDFLATVCLGNHLDRLPEELRRSYAEAVAERMGEPLMVDYVRLNIDARRPA